MLASEWRDLLLANILRHRGRCAALHMTETIGLLSSTESCRPYCPVSGLWRGLSTLQIRYTEKAMQRGCKVSEDRQNAFLSVCS